jgi:pimeloyl-ACP methyl ester carboxylesterase
MYASLCKCAVIAVIASAACASGRSTEPIGPEPITVATATATATTTADPPGAGPQDAKYSQVHGLKMYREIRGTGPTLVLLHGGTCTVDFWPEALEYFAGHYRVIAPEQIGHGHTPDDPRRPLDYHAMAEDTVELLRQLQVDSAFFLGWSDGGDVGLDVAMNHPALVRKLAVSGANIHPMNDAESQAWLRHVKPECGAGDKPFQDCWPPAMHDAYMRDAPDPKHWAAFLERIKIMWSQQPGTTKEQLGKIKSPTLVIAGDHDLVSLRETTEIFEGIPGAQLWVVPNSTHFVPKARAKLFNETVDAFFQEPPPAK